MPDARIDLTFLVVGIDTLSKLKPTNIVEIGSRDGLDTIFLKNHFKVSDENCHIFEANFTAAKEIIDATPSFNVYNYAIGTKIGTTKFIINHNNLGASSVLPRIKSDDKMEEVEVDAVDMKTVLNNVGISYVDICKIDVEGASLDVLKSFGDTLSTVKCIQIECELVPIWEGQSLYSEVRDFLEQNGFTLVLYGLVGQIQSESLWIRKEWLH